MRRHQAFALPPLLCPSRRRAGPGRIIHRICSPRHLAMSQSGTHACVTPSNRSLFTSTEAVLSMKPLPAIPRRRRKLSCRGADSKAVMHGLDVHWAFMYARDLDAALLVDALAVGPG